MYPYEHDHGGWGGGEPGVNMTEAVELRSNPVFLNFLLIFSIVL